LRRHLPVILAAVILAAAAIALYMTRTSPVHGWEQRPQALAKLEPAAKPTAPPAAVFFDERGRRLSLATFHGHAVLLNLWATWCAPCVRELPALAHLGRAVPGLTIVAVSEGRESAAETVRFLKSHGAGTLHIYVDPDHAFLEALGAEGLPLSMLIDASGIERAKALGPAEWDDPESIAWLRDVTRADAGP
jgi:thiol-disulfide isomerase/thioredoxin